ncbi:MAG: aldo/keto reductase [Eubacteriales bacterium]|nr:aldo/keto reductase [Eubacteriales bacterium]
MMQYTTIDGVRASRVAQGCMRIASLTAAQLDRLVRTDLEGGINFFDHADIYGGGACEERFGEFLHENPSLRGQMLIQTKCGIRKGMYDFSRAHILFCADRSLQLLKTDYLDFLLLHRPDALCEPEEVADAFETLKKAGKVRHFGVSNHNPMQMELLSRALGANRLCVNQLQFSMTNTTMLDAGLHVNMEDAAAVNRDGSVLDYCRLRGITVQPWSPFQHGFFEGPFIGNPAYAALNDALERIADAHGITPTGLAIAWILRHPAKMQPVIGTTNPDRVAEICRASDVVLSREEWYGLYRASGKTLP